VRELARFNRCVPRAFSMKTMSMNGSGSCIDAEVFISAKKVHV
jgi:hypothetical protein